MGEIEIISNFLTKDMTFITVMTFPSMAALLSSTWTSNAYILICKIKLNVLCTFYMLLSERKSHFCLVISNIKKYIMLILCLRLAL